jgi:hypothetical protein
MCCDFLTSDHTDREEHYSNLPFRKDYSHLRFTRVNAPTTITTPVTGKFARKLEPQTEPQLTSSESDHASSTEEETTDTPPFEVSDDELNSTDQAMMKIESVDHMPDMVAFPPSLIGAIEPYILPAVQLRKTKRLPFLLWNVQRGFRLKCETSGMDVTPDAESTETTLTVVYRWWKGTANRWYSMSINGWCCPLCSLHGTFAQRYMLESHLKWDHNELDIQWQPLVCHFTLF